jgi:hypothetical protein
VQAAVFVARRRQLSHRSIVDGGMDLGVSARAATAIGAQVIVLFDQPRELDLHDVEKRVDLLLVVATLANRWLLEGHIVDFGGSQRHGSPRDRQTGTGWFRGQVRMMQVLQCVAQVTPDRPTGPTRPLLRRIDH